MESSIVVEIETDVSNVMLFFDCDAYPLDGWRSWECVHGHVIFHEECYRFSWWNYLTDVLSG